jgi:hypothetical protein
MSLAVFCFCFCVTTSRHAYISRNPFGTFAVVLVGEFPKMTKTIFLLNPSMTNAKSCTDWAEIFSVLPFISKI